MDEPTAGKCRPITVSATILGEIRAEIGEVHGLALANAQQLENVLDRQVQLGRDMTAMVTRFDRVEREHVEQMAAGGCAPVEPAPGAPRSPSNLYESVGKRLEQQGEEVTERLKIEAILAAKEAVAEEIAEHNKAAAERTRQAVEVTAAQLKADTEVKAAQLKLNHDAKIAEIEMKHRRSMSRIAIGAAIVTALIGTGIFSAIRTLFSTEAAQAETTKALRRIEAKQARVPAARPIGE